LRASANYTLLLTNYELGGTARTSRPSIGARGFLLGGVIMKQQKHFDIYDYQKSCGAWGGATVTTTRLAHVCAGR